MEALPPRPARAPSTLMSRAQFAIRNGKAIDRSCGHHVWKTVDARQQGAIELRRSSPRVYFVAGSSMRNVSTLRGSKPVSIVLKFHAVRANKEIWTSRTTANADLHRDERRDESGEPILRRPPARHP